MGVWYCWLLFIMMQVVCCGKKKKLERKKKGAEKDEGSAVLYRLFICMGRITENKWGHGCKHMVIKLLSLKSFMSVFICSPESRTLKEKSGVFPTKSQQKEQKEKKVSLLLLSYSPTDSGFVMPMLIKYFQKEPLSRW